MKKLISVFLTTVMLVGMIGSTTMAKGMQQKPNNKPQQRIEMNHPKSPQKNNPPMTAHRTPNPPTPKTVVVEKDDNDTESLIAGLILGLVLSK